MFRYQPWTDDAESKLYFNKKDIGPPNNDNEATIQQVHTILAASAFPGQVLKSHSHGPLHGSPPTPKRVEM